MPLSARMLFYLFTFLLLYVLIRKANITIFVM
nr:MAG TPA: hypothetical protein [Caudoviricetes sp.]